LKQLKENSSNFKVGDLIYGLFCERVGIVTEVSRIQDGYQIVTVALPDGRVVLEHECYWIHMRKEYEYRDLVKRKQMWLGLASTDS
jgi:hypothetical protein